MEKQNKRYGLIGNIREDYQHEPRIIAPMGLVVNPQLVLKTYSMMKHGTENVESFIEVKNFLDEEIQKGNITPLIGLGFAILSEDMLNVARWDVEYPIVIKNQIYGYKYEQEGDLSKTAERLDINNVGAFCVWELGIVNHEKEAWKRFLSSSRMEENKKKYLEDVINGGKHGRH
ncbi:MAG: hypothetical protein KKA64_01660 [Nanoarchaeota archaeon]|nr:hypothetical protein [Nanoarchaeota archaeon]